MPSSAHTLTLTLCYSTVNMPTSSFSDSVCPHQSKSLYNFLYYAQSLTLHLWLPSLRIPTYSDFVWKPQCVQLRLFSVPKLMLLCSVPKRFHWTVQHGNEREGKEKRKGRCVKLSLFTQLDCVGSPNQSIFLNVSSAE